MFLNTIIAFDYEVVCFVSLMIMFYGVNTLIDSNRKIISPPQNFCFLSVTFRVLCFNAICSSCLLIIYARIVLSTTLGPV